MLELPESINISKQLKDVTVGKTVTNVVTAHSPHGFAFYSGEPDYYEQMLMDKTVTDIYHNAGQVEMEFGNVHLVFNDGVNIRYYEASTREPDKHQLLIRFDDDSFIVVKVQMYGGMVVFYEGEYDNFYYQVAKEKPSPLTSDFTEDYFTDMFNKSEKKLSAKAFLATEQRIPGLGNGILQDVLFEAGIHPQTKLKSMESSDIKSLYESVISTLKTMTENGGRNTEKDIYGNSGGYQTILSSKTWNEPCPKCGGPITKKAYLGGSVYFCPVCQPLIK